MLHKGFIDEKKLRTDVLLAIFDQGLTYKSVAEDICYAQSTLYAFLTGSNKVSKPLAEALIERFNLNERDYSTV